MQTTTLNPTYIADSASDSALADLRLTLEPERVARRQNLATLSDIDVMVAYASSGVSARNRQSRRCEWVTWDGGDLLCTLGLWVWPSDIDLEYELVLPPGVNTYPPVLVREPRDMKFWVSGGGEVELPWLLENATFEWHPAIGVWDAWSRPADPPSIERSSGARLTILGDGDARYGAIHARGEAVGWMHRVTIRYPTGNDRDPAAPAISVTNADDVEVSAVWTDERGERREETATLKIPDCVRALLEECPMGTGRGGSIRVKPVPGPVPWTVYYNSCNGRLLDVRREGGGE